MQVAIASAVAAYPTAAAREVRAVVSDVTTAVAERVPAPAAVAAHPVWEVLAAAVVPVAAAAASVEAVAAVVVVVAVAVVAEGDNQ